MKRTSLALYALLFAAVSFSQTMPELFQKAKEEVKAGSWTNAMKTLETLDAESSKPGNEAARKQLEAPLTFYRAVCEANLGQTDKAVEDFDAFLKIQPNAAIDATIYSKKAVAAFEKAQKAAAERAPSLADAYKEFRLPADPRGRDPADPLWAEGPARWIMTDGEKGLWAKLPSGNERMAFVETFWGARDPGFRKEFERRVAFADASLAQGAEQRGSLTDRGMVFVLLGPPTYAGRKPLRTGDDAGISDGLSTVGSQDAKNAQRAASGGMTTSGKLATLSGKYSGPGKTALDSSNNTLEVWHYRKELLPKSVPYQQVDFEFLTKTGYGVNTLQRESPVVTTLEAAKTAAQAP